MYYGLFIERLDQGVLFFETFDAIQQCLLYVYGQGESPTKNPEEIT